MISIVFNNIFIAIFRLIIESRNTMDLVQVIQNQLPCSKIKTLAINNYFSQESRFQLFIENILFKYILFINILK